MYYTVHASIIVFIYHHLKYYNINLRATLSSAHALSSFVSSGYLELGFLLLVLFRAMRGDQYLGNE